MNTTRSFISSLLIGASAAFTLAAVAMAQTATPTATVSPTASPTTAVVTATPTYVYQTTTPTPTATPNYSQTPTPTSAPSPTGTPVISTPNCVYFMRNLGVGTALTRAEMYLLNNVFLREGLPTIMTTTYDESYAANVVKIQAHYGIIQTGYFGPITRAKVNAIYGCAGLSTMTLSGGSTSPGGSGGGGGGGGTITCPAGYTCTPVNPVPVTVTCPAGYTCVPINNTTPTTPTIGTAPLPYSPTTYTTATDVNGTASIMNTFTDRAGTWGRFNGGSGILYSGNADWNVQLSLAITDNTSKTIKSIGLYHTGAGAPAAIEGWSTASRDDYGRSSFPLVVLNSSGQQLNNGYDQTVGTLTGTVLNYTLSGQVETKNWFGGKVIVDFTDGTQAVIPVGISPYSPTNGGGGYSSSLTMLSPYSGQVLQQGQQLTISWTGQNLSTSDLYVINVYNGPSVSIMYPNTTIASGITGMSYTWTVNGNNGGWGLGSNGLVQKLAKAFGISEAEAASNQYTIQVCKTNGTICSTGTVVTINGVGTMQPPVINGGTFPTSLNVGQTGTWTINASDPNNSPLSYSIEWGDTNTPSCPTGYTCSAGAAPVLQQSATFTHSYANAGTYTVILSVRNNFNLYAQTTATVTVGGSTSASPTASLLVNGQHSWTYNVGDVTSYRWSSTNADTFSSTYTANNPTQCGAGNWYANNAVGSIGSNVVSSYAGCVWTVTYTAKNSQTGQSASDSVTVTVNAATPIINLNASVVGTPTITKQIANQDMYGNSTSTYTATFNVSVAAVGGAVNIYLPNSSSPAGAFYGNYQIIQNGVAVNTVPAVVSYSQPSNGIISSDATYFTLGPAQTATIPVTVSFVVSNPGPNVYGVKLTGINWFNSQGKSQTSFSGQTSLVSNTDPSSLSASIWQAVSDWYTAHPSAQ